MRPARRIWRRIWRMIWPAWRGGSGRRNTSRRVTIRRKKPARRGRRGRRGIFGRGWRYIISLPAVRAAALGLAVVALLAMAAVTSLRWLEPPTSSIIWQRNWAAPAPVPPLAFAWRSRENISPHVFMAVIAAEDQRFFQHHGLDFVELYKSLREQRARLRGASTITQQVAKNMFLWNERSYARKILEAGLAIYIDFAWGKQRVLEVYLNIAQFGPAIYGVENASRHFFGKSAARLNRFEAARLAAVLPNPRTRSVAAPDAEVRERQRWILRQIRRLGEAELAAALD